MDDQRIEKWAGWLEGTIKSHVLTMHLQRAAWPEVSKMLAENAHELPDSYWWEFLRDTYATTQAVAVRRQADTMRGVASLGKLVEEVSGDPARFTREFFLATQDSGDDPYWAHVAEQNWAEHYGGEVHDHLDPAISAADVATLTDVGTRVRHYVDKHVVHAEASAPAVTLTLHEVHEAIHAIGHLFKKYDFLIQGGGWEGLEPAIQHNWMAAFTVPRMKRDDRRRRRG